MPGAGELEEEEESGLPGEAEPLQHAHTHWAGDVLQLLTPSHYIVFCTVISYSHLLLGSGHYIYIILLLLTNQDT